MKQPERNTNAYYDILRDKYFSFESFEKIPFSFLNGEERVTGFPSSFSPYVQEKRENFQDGKNTTVFVGRNQDNLEIKGYYTEYADSSASSWLFFITNKGNENTKILSDISLNFSDIEGTDPILYHGNGDNRNSSGFEFFTDKINNEFRIFSLGGTSCDNAFPYFRLMFNEFQVNCAVGWTGDWEADFIPQDGKITIKIKQQRTHSYLKPGETWRLPSVYFMPYEGDEKIGRNLWRRWYINHIMPKEGEKRLSPKLCLHTWMIDGKEEFCGANENNQILAIDEYINKGLKPDIWWIDAGWYPCGGHWFQIGSWYPNPENWPNGIEPVGKKCDENDIKLLLWFEPERAYENSDLWNNHPEWILHDKDERCNPKQCGLVNLGDSSCCEYMINLIDSIIKNSGVKIYRQDFNYTPITTWIDNESEDRIGFLENAQIQGYYHLWDELRTRNPGLLIDSCAAGGRRNDIETMQRAVPLHYTDVGYGDHPIKQKQHREMFEWIPYFRAHTMSWDDAEGNYTPGSSKPVDEYAFQCAMALAVTCMTEYYHDDEAFKLSTKMVAVWRKVSDMMLDGDYYPLTECKKSNEDYYAMQFDVEDQMKGFIQVVRNTRCDEDEFVVFPEIRGNSKYVFENPLTLENFTKTSSELKKGLKINIPKRSGIILMYEISNA